MQACASLLHVRAAQRRNVAKALQSEETGWPVGKLCQPFLVEWYGRMRMIEHVLNLNQLMLQ